MYPFYQSMALFWTLAEGLILLFLRSGWLSISGRETRQSAAIFLCASLFVFLACLMFGGESVFERLVVNLEKVSYLVAYRWGLVTFFCTLWVILEGIIMIYVLRVYRLVRTRSEGSGSRGLSFKPSSAFVVPLLVLFLILFYAFYEAHLVHLIGKHDLDSKPIYHISVFYIRLCGLFWIVFEWVIAVVGFRTYRTLKRWEGEGC
jgi:hypothetical protein